MTAPSLTTPIPLPTTRTRSGAVPASAVVVPDSTGPGPLPRAAWAVLDTWVVARRHLLRLVRRPDELLGTLLIPVLAVVMFGFVLGDPLGASVASGAGDYREFLLPGVFALTMAFGIGATTVSLAADARGGVLDRMRSLPSSPGAVLAGRALADLLVAIGELAILMSLGTLFGWQWHGGPAAVLGALGLLLLLRLAFSWVGIVLGLLVSGPEAAMKYFSLVFPLALVADTIVPATSMPGWLGAIAGWNPLSATVIATRELFGNPSGTATSWAAEHAQLLAVGWPLAIVAVCAPVSLVLLRRLGR